MADTPDTSPTLLSRLRSRPTDEEAWAEFVKRYGTLIEQWCRRWGMHPQDADDLTQDVLVELARQMSQFTYDPQGSFRAWLKTIAYRTWCDYLERWSRRSDKPSGATQVLRLLHSQEARDDFVQQFEDEWKRELLERAMQMVQRRVQPHTWEAFRLMTREGLSGAETASRLQIKVGAVWVAKSKVQKMIREEIQYLEQLETT